MIVADPNSFPNPVIDLIAQHGQALDADLFVVRRPLRNTDPPQSFGVAAANWFPDNESIEMKGVVTGSEPTISQYLVTVQAFVKHMDEVEGLAIHSTLSRMVRSMLYRDNDLIVGLRQLSVTTSTYTERMQRWGIRSQRYFSNELNATWLYLSTLEFWFETEMV